MNKTLYLHIGLHKTGTTSIQRALVKNKELLNKYGFDFLKPLYGYEFEEGTIRWWFKEKETNKITLERLPKLFEQTNKINQSNIIASGEILSWLFDEKSIAKIKENIKFYYKNCKIIIYIRRQDQLMLSLYQQSSKGPYGIAKDYFGRGEKSLPTNSHKLLSYFDFNERVKLWEKIFGRENIIIRVFEPEKLYKNDAVLDFFHILGINKDVKTSKINESNGFERTKIGHLLGKCSSDSFWFSVIIPHTNNRGKMLPSRTDAQAVYQLYKNSNIALNKRYGLSHENEAIFNNDFSNYPEKASDIWSEESANQAISNILKALNTLSLNQLIKWKIESKIKSKPFLYWCFNKVLKLYRLVNHTKSKIIKK